MTVDLVWLGSTLNTPIWSLGRVYAAEPTPRAVHTCITMHLDRTQATIWLFWHPRLGTPDPERIKATLALPGDVWHAGLRLGMTQQPPVIDYVAPTWTLNRDPNPDIVATSWRLSLSACLVRVEVLRQMGGVEPDFHSLDAAGLEMGYRYITSGVIIRHTPQLVPENAAVTWPGLPFSDQLRFLNYGFRNWQVRWAVFRAIAQGMVSPLKALQTLRQIETTARTIPVQQPYQRPQNPPPPPPSEDKVTVLIPTLYRYPFLRTVLGQLREQTVPPTRIVIVDQTEGSERDTTLASDFADLPLELLYQNMPGQCSSRNRGLQVTESEYVLFLDDDDEIPSDLIEKHLTNLKQLQLDVSSGAADEVGAGPLPENFTFQRVSDGFPTNNSMIRRNILQNTGLFDLAYDHRSRADGDLGMRIYLSGALMWYDPAISVLHHHAPLGGLRVHKARVITYASSRQFIRHRHLPSVSEIYFARRYFTEQQVREALWLRVFGTFSIRGSSDKKLLKIGASMVYMPDTLWQIMKRWREAGRLFDEFPQIPSLETNQHGSYELSSTL